MDSVTNDSRKVPLLLVLKEAMLSSLYATKRLASKHTGKNFEKWVSKICNLIDKKFKEYLESKKGGIADFTIFSDIENNIRKWHFQIARIWLKSWGIDVKKRIRNSQANQDYFNRLLDIAGAIQRDFACRYYWFPSVIEYNYYEDTNEIINIMHDDLPSLDFIEITRPFILEMTLWFTLFHIPVYKYKQYVWYFLIECRPYLDWIHKGGRRGVNSNEESLNRIDKSFGRMDEMDHKMEDIITLAKTQYGTINSYDNVTDLSKEGLVVSNKFSLAKFLETQEVEKRYHSFLDSTAINKLFQHVNEESRKIGIQFHHFLLNSFPQPKSLRHVIENGDMYTDDRILIITETFLSDKGLRGKADLIVLLKCNIDNKLVWKPILLIDIKSKSACYWNFYGKSSRYNKNRITPHFHLSPRPVTEGEWVRIIQETPNEYEHKQLKMYCKLIEQIFVETLSLSHFKRLNILRGVLVVDPVVETKTKLHGWMLLKEDIIATIYSFVEQIMNSNKLENIFYTDRIEIIPEDTRGTFSLIIEKPDRFNSIIPEILIEPIKVRTAIFEKLIQDESTGKPLREFNLYLYGKTNTSSGDIAAWISRFVNLLKIIKDRFPTKKVLVLDIMSELSRALDHPLVGFNSVIWEQQKISIIELSDFSKKYEVPLIDPNYDVYIICGWDLFTQIDINGVSKSVESEILTSLPQNKTIYWIDRASYDFHQNAIYQKPTLFPYNLFNRPLRSAFVTNLIFDLPSPPRNLLERSSQYPEYRVLVEFSSTNKLISRLTYIHELRHINSRFSNKFKYRNYKRKSNLKPKQQRKIISKAISLLPWLNNFVDVEIFNLSYDLEIALNIQPILLQSFLQEPRLSYHPTSTFNENEEIIPKEFINSNLQIKTNFQDIAPVRQTTIFPLHTNLLKPGWDKARAKSTEILRIKGILGLIENSKYLRKILPKAFQELVNQSYSKLQTGSGIRHIIFLIENFEIDNGENPLWNIIKPVHQWQVKKFILQNREIKYLVQEELEENLYFGISIYFLLKILSYKFTNIDDRIIISIWKQNFSFILRQIGFKVKNHAFPQSKYRIKTLYHHLHRNLESFEKTRSTDYVITNIKYGKIWGNDRFTLLEYRNDISNKLIEIVFDISWKQKLSPDANLYFAVTNPRKKDFARTELIELNCSKFAFFSYLDGEYISIYDSSLSKWQLIGRIKLIMFKDCNKVRALKIDQSNLNIDDIKFNTPDRTLSIEEVERHEIDEPIEILIKIGYEGGEFFIEHFNIEDYQDNGNDFDDLTPIWTTWFEYTEEFLNYFHNAKSQFLKDTVYTGNKRLYQLNVFGGIFYNKFKFLRPYVESSKFHNSEILKYPRKCEKLYKQNLDIIEDGLTEKNTAEILVSHLPAYCQVSDVPFDIIFKSPYNPIKKPGSLKKMDRKFRHWLCIQLTLLNLKALPKSLISKIHKKVISPPALKILALKGFEEDPESGEIFKLTFDFEMEEDEFGNEILNPVFHQDLDIISTIYELTGTWISSTYPNAHLEPNKFIFDKISFGNDGSLYFHYFYLLTGKRLYYEIPGSDNSCIEQIRHHSGIDDFESIIDKDTIENYDDYVNSVKGYKQELREHFDECLFCKKAFSMIDSGEILFDLTHYELEKGMVYIKGVQKLPYKRIEEDSKISWKYSKMDDLEDIVEEVVQMGREVISGNDLSEDYFPVNFYLSNEALGITFADFLDNLVADLPLDSMYRKENNAEVDWLIQRLDTLDYCFDARAPEELQTKYISLKKKLDNKQIDQLLIDSELLINNLRQDFSLINAIYILQIHWLQFLAVESYDLFSLQEKRYELDSVLTEVLELMSQIGPEVTQLIVKLRAERIRFHGILYFDKSIVLSEQGKLLNKAGRFEEAKEAYLESIEIRDLYVTHENEHDRLEIRILLGNVCFNLGDFDKSNYYYEDVGKIIDGNPQHELYSYHVINFAKIYYYQGELEKTRIYLNKVIDCPVEEIGIDNKVYCNEIMGNLEFICNNKQKSKSYFLENYELLQAHEHPKPDVLSYQIMKILMLNSIMDDQSVPSQYLEDLKQTYFEFGNQIDVKINYLLGKFFVYYNKESIIDIVNCYNELNDDWYSKIEIISGMLVYLYENLVQGNNNLSQNNILNCFESNPQLKTLFSLFRTLSFQNSENLSLHYETMVDKLQLILVDSIGLDETKFDRQFEKWKSVKKEDPKMYGENDIRLIVNSLLIGNQVILK